MSLYDTLTVEQKIQKAHFYIMHSPNFVAYLGILLLGEVTVDENTPTACTDGYNVKYGREFMDSLIEQEVRFVVLHENLHKMFRHLVTWRHLWKQDPVRANKATDHVINAIILEAQDPGVKMPKLALYDKKYTGMDSGEVFRLLPPTPPCPICNAGGRCDKDGNPVPMGKGGCPHGGFDDHDWEAAGELTDEEVREQREEIDSAIRQGSILAGQVNGKIPREFGGLTEVPIDYAEVLRQFLTSYCRGGDISTFRRPSRRWLYQDIYMPTTITETLDEVVIAVDTSGSIGGEALNEFISHVVNILTQVNPNKIHLLYWDHHVAGHETYFQGDAAQLQNSTKPVGGGGTAPSCITKYMQKHNLKPTCAVVLTDGYVGSDWGGTWSCPVLWVIKNNKAAVPTVGAVAHF